MPLLDGLPLLLFNGECPVDMMENERRVLYGQDHSLARERLVIMIRAERVFMQRYVIMEMVDSEE